MKRRLFTLLPLLLLFAPIEAQQPTFTSNTSLVVIDVNVKDKSGKPMPGLKKGDFTLLEDGKPQQISVFEFQQLDGNAPPPPKVPADKPVNQTPTPAPVQRTAEITVPTGTTRPVIRFQDRRLVAMLFDFSTMAIPEQSRAQEAALRFIREQLKPADLVEIMTASTGPLKIEQDFTDDRDRLEEVVKKFQIGVASELSALGSDGDDTTGEDNGTAFNADETEFNIFNTDRKLATLESAAKLLAAFPEKKALIYFSSGINKSGFDNQAQLDSAVNAAKRANVSFYPIDARGLVASAPLGNADTAASRGTSMFSGTQLQKVRAISSTIPRRPFRRWPPTPAASSTSMTTISPSAWKKHATISAVTTSLATTATTSKWMASTGASRSKLAGNIEAKLDYRSGYFGQKQFAKFTSTDKEDQLQQALMLGDPLTDLSLSGELDYFRLARDRYFIPFSVKIPGAEIALAKKRGRRADRIRFHRPGARRARRLVQRGARRDQNQTRGADRRAARVPAHRLRYRLHPASRQILAASSSPARTRPARWELTRPSSPFPISRQTGPPR